MAMTLADHDGPDEPDVVPDMNTTPLIDVMLVLLIMLIVTIPIATHAVNLDVAAGPPPAAAPPQVVSIDVDAAGGFSWNGQQLSGRQDLEDRLRGVASVPPQPEIHVRPDGQTSYKDVAAVLAAAQRLGVTTMGIVDDDTQ